MLSDRQPGAAFSGPSPGSSPQSLESRRPVVFSSEISLGFMALTEHTDYVQPMLIPLCPKQSYLLGPELKDLNKFNWRSLAW